MCVYTYAYYRRPATKGENIQTVYNVRLEGIRRRRGRARPSHAHTWTVAEAFIVVAPIRIYIFITRI